MRTIATLLACCFALTASAADPTVRFADRTLTVNGVRPGARMLIFGIAKLPRAYDYRIVRWHAITTDEDKDGTVSYTAPERIPDTSAWVIADLTNGHCLTAAPSGVARVPRGRSAVHREASRFSFDRVYLDLVYVHPGKGAWTWHAVDGGRGDADGANGVATIDVSAAERLDGDERLTKLSSGGRLIAIDFLDLTVLQIDATELLGGQQ